ncbi:MAG TPA: STAS domain-containing protein [Gemmatimonadaceae bacterium]|jgi:rsbT co-antagonist protein RsbR|nr:STAS domain-containing protein [Gemmatimonadaceae bacterium]
MDTATLTGTGSDLPRILKTHENLILTDWMREQRAFGGRIGTLTDADLESESRHFLSLLRQAVEGGNVTDTAGPAYGRVREMLSNLSRTRAVQGYSPSETATFVMSLKQPLFSQLCRDAGADTDRLASETWTATTLLDKLALFTTETFQRGREELIARQQQDMLELSTPVVKLWDGILALPMIGTLDSSRTQVVMESLLQRIVDTGAEIAILDITGVPTVDTLTAQHLLKTVTAARLMGADCIISGIRPQIAQTIVHLGVDLQDIITKANLADALKTALTRRGLMITKAPHPGVPRAS